jgi:hypothetical protein
VRGWASAQEQSPSQHVFLRTLQSEAASLARRTRMLRTLVFVLALAAPSLAAAQQFPASPLGQDVRGHDGAVLGRVTSVERDAQGRIVAVEIPGLEPADAPSALVAQSEREDLVRDHLVPVRDSDRARARADRAGADALRRLR